MMLRSGLLVVVLVASAAAVADVKRHEFVPDPLRGSWGTGADACADDDKSLITLSANGYERAGEKCAVVWVSETAGPSGSIYSARLRCPGQSDATPSYSDLIMRRDGTKVAIGSKFDNLVLYEKCPARP